MYKKKYLFETLPSIYFGCAARSKTDGSLDLYFLRKD